MDGARLMNAVVASGCSTQAISSHVDTVWIDLSKGLGAPVGAVLAGPADFIEKSRLLKHRFGGAMRQAGIIAAAGLYAFEHNVERMAERGVKIMSPYRYGSVIRAVTHLDVNREQCEEAVDILREVVSAA
jgi:threonine aldolase